MIQRMHVGVVIESLSPAAWVVDLLQRLCARQQIALTVFQASTFPVSDAPPDGQKSFDDSLIKRMSRWWLMQQIDKPLFEHDPWNPTALPSTLSAVTLSSEKGALSACHIIVNLCAGTIPELSGISSDVPCWSARLQTLDTRVEHYLLHDAPLMWLHLWDIRQDQPPGSNDGFVIASHALPRHTFSLTDLRRLCFSCLPSLFESRLVWHANNRQAFIDDESQQTDPGVFAEERIAAQADAARWQRTGCSPQKAHSLQYAARVARLFWRQSVERIRARFYEEHWQLAAFEHSAANPLSVHSLTDVPVDNYKDLALSKDVIWADPHVQEYNGDHYVFFEKMHKHDKRAHIAVARLDDARQLGKSSVALAEDCHLSYPFVFEANGALYMIPETGSQRSIRLYKAQSFPHDWLHVSDLISDTDSADTTLFYYNDRWWMFTNRQSHRCVDERDELHIHMADELLGPWQAHPLNPVLTGVDRARMAGPIITEAGMHYRVSQYGAKRYGRGINISRIDELSPRNYRETALHRLEPGAGSRWQGCHTLGFANGLTIIDRVRYRLR